MAAFKSLVITMMEEQASLLQKHIALLKSGDAVELAAVAVADASGKKLRKAKKEPVDPNKPKKSPSAYILYMGENQAPFKASNPTMTQIEVMTALGNRWTALPLTAKEKFMKQADTHKQLYDMKMAAYLSGSSSSVAAKSPAKAAPAKAAASPQPVAVPAPPAPVAAAVAEEKEHKKKKKRSHKEEEVVVEKVEAVPEPVAVPESEKKKKKHKKSKDTTEA